MGLEVETNVLSRGLSYNTLRRTLPKCLSKPSRPERTGHNFSSMRRPINYWQILSGALLLRSSCLGTIDCSRVQPSIEFTVIPPAGERSPNRIEFIEGIVKGAAPGQRIVILSQSGVWWLQPSADRPFVDIQADSRWKSATHPGSAYAALLVNSQYQPRPKMDHLPTKGGSVLAVASAPGAPPRPLKVLQFSGYPWNVRETAGESGHTINLYDSSNAWTDQGGSLHLRVMRRGDKWVCAQVTLVRSLGYGSYRFVTRDISHLEPAAILIGGFLSQMDFEIGRWGHPEEKNEQYIIKPAVVPANTVRFTAPGGPLTNWMIWGPGHALFRTVVGSSPKAGAHVVAEHDFTSGTPSPGIDRVGIHLYVLGQSVQPLRQGFEVIVDKFEFLP